MVDDLTRVCYRCGARRHTSAMVAWHLPGYWYCFAQCAERICDGCGSPEIGPTETVCAKCSLRAHRDEWR